MVNGLGLRISKGAWGIWGPLVFGEALEVLLVPGPRLTFGVYNLGYRIEWRCRGGEGEGRGGSGGGSAGRGGCGGGEEGCGCGEVGA